MDEFQHLTESNLPPSSDEGSKIDDLCKRSADRIDALNYEISRLKAALDILVQERDTLEADRMKCQSILSPLRRFPPEILQSIFVDCLECFPILQSPYEAPVVLCQVCSRWRQVALNTPTLWSSLSIVFPIRRSKLCPGRQGAIIQAQFLSEWLQVWLERAGDMPLDISVNVSSEPHVHGLSYETLYPIFLTLRVHCRRWRWMELHVFSHIWLIYNELFGELQLDDLPLLETLIVGDHAGREIGVSPTALRILQQRPSVIQAPRLTNLCIGNTLLWNTFSPNLLDTSPLFERLHSLYLYDSHSSPSAARALSIIRLAPNLVSFGWKIGHMMAVTESDTPELSFTISSSLKTLCLMIPMNEMSLALLNLETPNLEHLLLQFPRTRDDIPNFTCLPQFLHTSKCALKSLQWDVSFAQAPESFIDILRLQPSLQTLNMLWIGDHILKALIVHPSSSPPPESEILLPNLKSIKYSYRGVGSELIDELTVKFLQSRTDITTLPPGVVKLESATILTSPRRFTLPVIPDFGNKNIRIGFFSDSLDEGDPYGRGNGRSKPDFGDAVYWRLLSGQFGSFGD